MRLRSHLVVLVLVAVVPLLVFSVAMLRQAAEDQRAVLDQGMRNTASALSLAIDGEVKASQAILETLAASAYLDTGDLRAFYRLCTKTIEGRPNAYIVLFDRSGRPLLNSSRPFGSSLPNPLLATRPAGIDPSGRVGRRLAPTLAAQVAGSPEAAGMGRTVEGMPVYHVFTRSPNTGWTTSLAVSQAVVSSSIDRSIVLLGGGAVLALILGLGAALGVGRRISNPLSMLAGAAGSMVGGEQTDLKGSAVREVVELHRALVTAGG